MTYYILYRRGDGSPYLEELLVLTRKPNEWASDTLTVEEMQNT